MTSGGSLNLAKGQFGIFDVQNTSANGAKAVSSFAGQPKNKKYELRLGKSNLPVTRSQNNKSFSSFPFELRNVLDLHVSAPKRTEQSVDEVLVGYNGIDDTTAITFKKGEIHKMYVELSGEAIGLLGYNWNKVVIPVYMEADSCSPLNNCEDCDPCETVEALPIVLQAIEALKNHQLRGGVKVSDYVDVTPIRECGTTPVITEIPYNFFCLEVCDTGDDSALALVQAQYPDVKVELVERNGSISKYKFMQPDTASAPADYVQSIPSLIKGCADCPSGYTEVAGGLIYAVTLEDDGADESLTVETLANAVGGTAIKANAQNDGVGYYTVVLSETLSDANFDTFISANPTATITFVGETQSICENGTVTQTAWEQCGTCNVIEEAYSINLPDTECGQDRLAELRQHYPSLDIYMGDGTATVNITLTGTVGEAAIEINGSGFSATFDTDLTTTADNFVTDNAAAILSEQGVTVTANAGVLTFVGDYQSIESIIIYNDASPDLNGTVGTVVYNNVVAGGCQTQYTTSVKSNLVCDECDDIFKDYFKTSAPESYDTRQWKKVTTGTGESDCKVGIRLKGKVFEIQSDECTRDMLNFSDSAVNIRVSGGYTTEVREGIGETEDAPFNVEYKSRYERRTHMGGNLFEVEDRNRVFFTGEARHYNDNVAKMFKGEESHIDPSKQYVDYALTVRRDTYSQSFGGRSEDNVTYHVFVEVGRHQAVEDLLNSLAAAAGITTVKAFGV